MGLQEPAKDPTADAPHARLPRGRHRQRDELPRQPLADGLPPAAGGAAGGDEAGGVDQPPCEGFQVVQPTAVDEESQQLQWRLVGGLRGVIIIR